MRKKTILRRVGGPEYRKSGYCEICKSSFKEVPFGHHFRTSRGSIDTCEFCAQSLYETVMTDIAGGIFALKRDIDETRSVLYKLVKERVKKRKRSSKK